MRWVLFKLLLTLTPFLTSAWNFYLVEIDTYLKPPIIPYIESAKRLIKRNWGNYTELTALELTKKVFHKGDVVILMGEYSGFKLSLKGHPSWVILDYCNSCSSLGKIDADYILCSETTIPAPGFIGLYFSNFPPDLRKIGDFINEGLSMFGYKGKKIKVVLFKKSSKKEE